jgi:hypothetical protein
MYHTRVTAQQACSFTSFHRQAEITVYFKNSILCLYFYICHNELQDEHEAYDIHCFERHLCLVATNDRRTGTYDLRSSTDFVSLRIKKQIRI